ncbi:MAG: glycine/sarcosine/betaine reductase selenoprotein B family protein [Anaerolineales bacterium]|jgi:D-proline reductase (dithiol) PrdB
MPVDSFKFLPRLIAIFYQATEVQPRQPIPWTPLEKPLTECVFGLVTSGGLYHKDVEPPFDLEREKSEPTWGDPSYRTIPRDISQSDVGVSHLHINPEDVLADFNILLPIHRFHELAEDGVIGGLAEQNYSFMGFQGYPPDTTEWGEVYGPQVAELFKSEGVACVLLTPA